MPKRICILAALSLLAGCRGDGTKKVIPDAPPVCGDAIINPAAGEECEGSDLGGATCVSKGFDKGSLVCGADCRLSTAGCEKTCGNGKLDGTEECDGDAGVGTCSGFGYRACTAMCKTDLSHCVSTLFSVGTSLPTPKGGVTRVGDLEPKGPADLAMVVPSFSRVELFAWNSSSGFGQSRKLSFSRSPSQVEVHDVDSDGRLDLVVINDDGAVDRYLALATSFSLSQVPDAGCPAHRFIGRSKDEVFATACADGGVAGSVLLALRGRSVGPPSVAQAIGDLDGDGKAELLYVPVGAAELHTLSAPAFDAGTLAGPLPASPSAFAAGDLDGDGDGDLLALDGANARIWENTGALTGFAQRSSVSSANARFPFIVDLDLDGRQDLVWLAAERVHVRRNLGNFQFATVEAQNGSGAELSLSVADLDGDGDLDLITTVSNGGDATTTHVHLNQVK